MISYCRLNIENCDAIDQRAKNKKDGAYKFRGIAYRVINGRVTHYAVGGKVSERAYGFLIEIGSYDGNDDAAIKALQTIKAR